MIRRLDDCYDFLVFLDVGVKVLGAKKRLKIYFAFARVLSPSRP